MIPPTGGEIIRGLIPMFYPDSYSLNLAVNEHRRANGFKNWHAAAVDLLERHRAYGARHLLCCCNIV